MTLLRVNRDLLRDQADIVFNVANDLLDDQPEIVKLLHGAAYLLIEVWKTLDVGSQVLIVSGHHEDDEGDYDWAMAEIDVMQRKMNGFLNSPKGIYFIDECEVEVDEDLIWDLLVEQSNFFHGSDDPGLVDVESAHEDDGQVFVIVEDRNYQVDDPEASRNFAMVRATPGLNGSGVDFEEL